jgi:hypothetical protein
MGLLMLVLPLSAFTDVATAQQIYPWTDASGKVHFGNQPPPGAQGLEAKDEEKSEGVRYGQLPLQKLLEAFASHSSTAAAFREALSIELSTFQEDLRADQDDVG